MFKKIFSFFLLSFLFSPQAIANTSYTMPDTLLDYINNTSPTTSGGYTSIKNDGTSASDSLFSIDYFDENGDEQNLYFNVYNENTKVTSFGERITSASGDINSNFIGLFEISSTTAQGGAIYNFSSTIGDITGDFIANYAKSDSDEVYGGAISNNYGDIGNITGNFTSNYIHSSSNNMGGAIYSSGTFGVINGNFINNYAYSENGDANGGAIASMDKISSITGDFIGNYASGNTALGGAIAFMEEITSITGNFIGNYASGNTALGGAIINMAGTSAFLADNRTFYFTDNYTLNGTTKSYNAIHNEGGEMNFIMKGNGSFVMNDSITGNVMGRMGTINITGENANNNIFYLNDSISGNTANLSNATLKLGSYTHDDGTITSGYSSDTNATINFTNNSLLSLDLIDFDFTNKSILSKATLNFKNSALTARNANTGTYNIGTSATLDTVTSASSLHSITNVSGNSFTVNFNQDSTLISNSQLGKFMSEIGNSSTDKLSAQSTSSANRFIFQASQVGTDTKKQAAIVDGGAQLSAMGASHALAHSAISAKKGSINTRISQELAYNVENFIASNGNTKGLITEKKENDISLWLMPHYTHERVSGMDSGSFSHGYTSHLFGLTLGADKNFYLDESTFYSLGLALDAGTGFANTRDDIENVKNNFNTYGATVYNSLYIDNLMLSTKLGYLRNDNKIQLDMEAYDALENQYADITSDAYFASAKAEYNVDMLYFFHSKEEKKKEAAIVAKLQAEQEKQKAEELAMRENAKDPDSLPEPTIYEEIPDYEMPSFFAMLYGETHRKNATYRIKEDYDRTMSFLLVPYIGLDFMTINSGEYEVYSYNNGKTDTTFNVESERQNVFTIPLGIQIKPELAEVNGIKVSPQVKLGLAYSFGDLAEKSTTTAKDLSAIAYLETENIDAFRGDFGLSANIKPTKLDNMNFDLGYDLEVSKNRFAHDFRAKFEFKF